MFCNYVSERESGHGFFIFAFAAAIPVVIFALLVKIASGVVAVVVVAFFVIRFLVCCFWLFVDLFPNVFQLLELVK